MWLLSIRIAAASSDTVFGIKPKEKLNSVVLFTSDFGDAGKKEGGEEHKEGRRFLLHEYEKRGGVGTPGVLKAKSRSGVPRDRKQTQAVAADGYHNLCVLIE